jgi:hypothetical protein
MLVAIRGTELTTMAISHRMDSLPLRVLRYVLLDAFDDARGLLRRSQDNEAFRRYLRRRRLYVIPLAAVIVAASLAFTGATVVFIARAGTLLAFLAMMIAPLVLIASLSVQSHVLLSWIEGRSLEKTLGHRAARAPGPFGRWFMRKFRIDMGPFPRVPWVPALLFVIAPLAMLAGISITAAATLVAVQISAAILYARLDR